MFIFLKLYYGQLLKKIKIKSWNDFQGRRPLYSSRKNLELPQISPKKLEYCYEEDIKYHPSRLIIRLIGLNPIISANKINPLNFGLKVTLIHLFTGRLKR